MGNTLDSMTNTAGLRFDIDEPVVDRIASSRPIDINTGRGEACNKQILEKTFRDGIEVQANRPRAGS
jgi:chemotaxis protein CheY-P-specific phosphatase CheC